MTFKKETVMFSIHINHSGTLQNLS